MRVSFVAIADQYQQLKPQIDAMIDQVKAFNTRIATSLPEAPPLA